MNTEVSEHSLSNRCLCCCCCCLLPPIYSGFASPTGALVVGGSHGGFLTGHLLGQHPDRFVCGAMRNPVLNISLMVGLTDIPDWCFVEVLGSKVCAF
jgi:acylaminoacyl-peptidase